MTTQRPQAETARPDSERRGVTDLTLQTATALAALIARREVSPVEAVEAHLRRLDAIDPRIHAFVSVRAEKAMLEARAAEKEVFRPTSLGPLHGVPIAVKDEGHLAGEATSYGLRVLKDHVVTRTAPDVRRLQAAGAIVVGKTNMPEFGHKGVTDNRFIGPTSSPFDLTKNAGGSSGGSAAAVGACLAPLAQGGDGGGSIRIPAALSGVYGLKPSWGRVPTYNRPDAFAFSMPMVSYGPLARTVEDAALMLQVTAGPNEDDPLSLPADPVNYLDATQRDMSGRRVAYWPTFGGFMLAPQVRSLVDEAVVALSENGVLVQEVDGDLGAPVEELLESWKRGASLTYAVLIESLRADGLDLLGGHRAELSPSFLQYVDRGETLTAGEHRKENFLRSRVFDRLEALFAQYDFIVTPTLSVAAVDNVGDGRTVGPSEIDGKPVDAVLGWTMCYPVNFAGHPAASLPAGLTAENHPVGLQIIGRRFRDDEVLALSAFVQRLRPWYEFYASHLAV